MLVVFKKQQYRRRIEMSEDVFGIDQKEDKEESFFGESKTEKVSICKEDEKEEVEETEATNADVETEEADEEPGF